MLLHLERFGYGYDSTLGRLTVDGIEHICFTIEDERREVKKAGETAIPVGTYKIKLRTEGTLTKKYQARFPTLHRGMLWLQNVPGFEYVYLHIGNTDDDSEGCPLTVTTPTMQLYTNIGDCEFQGAGSEAAYLRLYTKVINAMDEGEDVSLTVNEK